jgi:hypothetical protein
MDLLRLVHEIQWCVFQAMYQFITCGHSDVVVPFLDASMQLRMTTHHHAVEIFHQEQFSLAERTFKMAWARHQRQSLVLHFQRDAVRTLLQVAVQARRIIEAHRQTYQDIGRLDVSHARLRKMATVAKRHIEKTQVVSRQLLEWSEQAQEWLSRRRKSLVALSQSTTHACGRIEAATWLHVLPPMALIVRGLEHQVQVLMQRQQAMAELLDVAQHAYDVIQRRMSQGE